MRVSIFFKGFRKPWFVFVVIAICLMGLESLVKLEKKIIDVSSSTVEALSLKWELQMKRPPNKKELRQLIARYIEDEMFYKEALALGLNEEDSIIKRRLIQKLQFLYQESPQQAAKTQDLKRFYQANKAHYVDDEALSFYHIFFSNPPKKKHLASLKRRLNESENPKTSWQQEGDASMLARSYANRASSDLKALFGPDFSRMIQELPLRAWTGPIDSFYGTHLVYVFYKVPGKQRSFEEALPQLKVDYAKQSAQKSYQKKVKALKKTYRVMSDVL